MHPYKAKSMYTKLISLSLVFIALCTQTLAIENLFNPDYDDSMWNQAQNPWENTPFYPVSRDTSMWDVDDGQLAIFRTTFELDAAPTSASLAISADNAYYVMINGADPNDNGFGAAEGNWRDLETYDVTSVLKTGKNIIVIIAYDLGGYEGLFAQLTVDETVVSSSSDGNWKSLSLALSPEGIDDNLFNPEFDLTIWNSAESPWSNAPGGAVHSASSMWDPDDGQLAVFRRQFSIETLPTEALLKVSVDNAYMISVNAADTNGGGGIWIDGNWRDVETIDVTENLKVGENIIFFAALELGGFEGAYVELLADGEPVVTGTDGEWRSLSLNLPIPNPQPSYDGYLYLQFPWVYSFKDQKWIYLIENPWLWDFGLNGYFQLGSNN